nr:RIO1 family regulatory kinase/ATPase [Nakamurella flava]
MPRISPHDLFDLSDSADTPDASRSSSAHDRYDVLHDDGRDRSRRRPGRRTGPTVRVQGRSGRFDLDVDRPDPEGVSDPDTEEPTSRLAGAADPLLLAPLTSYDVATHGPEPAPDWLVTSLAARDVPLGGLKSGKEADVALLRRGVADGPDCLLAVKTYRSAEHRMFHRDSGYLQGRRVRRSRETRALARRSTFGRELLAGQWAAAEFAALTRSWELGVRVPYPVQLLGSEVMMQFVGTPDGAAAARLAAAGGGPEEMAALWDDLRGSLDRLAEAGYTHGDLSPYNVLVEPAGDGPRAVLIDLPQLVDVVANPQGRSFLDRDARTIAAFFTRRGVPVDPELLALRWWSLAQG